MEHSPRSWSRCIKLSIVGQESSTAKTGGHTCDLVDLDLGDFQHRRPLILKLS